MIIFNFDEKRVTSEEIISKIDSLTNLSIQANMVDGSGGRSLENKPLPKKNEYLGVSYLIKESGYYISNIKIDKFLNDAFNLKADNITLDFEGTGSIEASNPHRGTHRDAIQLIPSGGLHYAGYALDYININSVKITSSNMLSELQGITGFDGLYSYVNLDDIEIDVQNDNAITFFGLRYGSFTKVTITGGGDITLNPLRLCGGGNTSTPSILIVGPWVDNYGNEQQLYYENYYESVDGNIIDNRMAFSKEPNAKVNLEAEIRLKNYIFSHGNTEVYSHLKIGTLWTEVKNSTAFKREIDTNNQEEIKRKSEDILKEIHKSVRRNAEKISI